MGNVILGLLLVGYIVVTIVNLVIEVTLYNRAIREAEK